MRLPPLDATSNSKDEIIPPKKRKKTATCTVSKPDHDNGKTEDEPKKDKSEDENVKEELASEKKDVKSVTIGHQSSDDFDFQNESRDFGKSSNATVDYQDLPDLVSTSEVNGTDLKNERQENEEKHDSVTNIDNDLESTREYSDGDVMPPSKKKRTEEEPNHNENGKNNEETTDLNGHIEDPQVKNNVEVEKKKSKMKYKKKTTTKLERMKK